MQARRQLVNVVMRKLGKGSNCWVSRMNPEEQLFYPSTEEAQAAAPSPPTATEKMETLSRSRTPALKLRFSDAKMLHFLPFHERGTGGYSKILCTTDAAGHTVVYDTDADSIHPVPSLSSPKGFNPVSFSIRDDRSPRDPARAQALYVMARYPRGYDRFSFEALMYSDTSSSRRTGRNLKGWYWHPLPPPPAHVDTCKVTCHALIDDDDHRDHPVLIVSSTKASRVGTYCFNTATNRWLKAGSWTLPFVDRAEHVPELDSLCFGIHENWPYNFCAMDLSSSFDTNKPPLLVYNWEDLTLPGDWVMVDCSMVYLGGGRFCIAKIFEFYVGNNDQIGSGAVISGLEVVHHGEPSKLLMVNHKSKFYKFIRDEIERII